MQLTSRLGDTIDCYSAGNEKADNAILIIHDWWGIKPYNREWADRLAGLGYRALVIDLYNGENPADAQEAGEMMRNIDQEAADAKLLTALEYLNEAHQKVAVLGWSFGGLQAQYATLLDPQSVAATVFYYCRVISGEESVSTLQGPVLGIFSETERTWPEKQEKWIAAMDAAGKSYEFQSYNADHGFVNPESPRYDKDATDQSWQLTVDFLQRNL
jgi:carboxymethylenebutenolidase